MNAPSNPTESLADGAARAWVAARCQRAYLHEVRGGLQALSGAFELLARLARTRDGDAGVVDRATSIAKRALANHEAAMIELIKQITAAADEQESVDLTALIEDVLRFLRNDISARQLEIRFERDGSQRMCVDVPRHQLRLLLLGLISRQIDSIPPRSALSLRLAVRDGQATLELGSPGGMRPAREAVSEEEADRVLDWAQHWSAARGGGLEPVEGSSGMLRWHLPLGSEPAAQA